MQQKEAKDCKSHVDHLADIIDTLEVSNSQMATRFEGIKDKQITIYQGLLAVMRKIEVLRAHDSPVQASEIRYRERLNRILAALRGPYMDLQELTSSLVRTTRTRLRVVCNIFWFDGVDLNVLLLYYLYFISSPSSRHSKSERKILLQMRITKKTWSFS